MLVTFRENDPHDQIGPGLFEQRDLHVALIPTEGDRVIMRGKPFTVTRREWLYGDDTSLSVIIHMRRELF